MATTCTACGAPMKSSAHRCGDCPECVSLRAQLDEARRQREDESLHAGVAVLDLLKRAEKAEREREEAMRDRDVAESRKSEAFQRLQERAIAAESRAERADDEARQLQDRLTRAVEGATGWRQRAERAEAVVAQARNVDSRHCGATAVLAERVREYDAALDAAKGDGTMSDTCLFCGEDDGHADDYEDVFGRPMECPQATIAALRARLELAEGLMREAWGALHREGRERTEGLRDRIDAFLSPAPARGDADGGETR